MRYIRLIQQIRHWWLYLQYKAGWVQTDTLRFESRNGNVHIDVPIRLIHEFKEIFMENAYGRGLGKPVPKKAIIIDIGANVGFFTLFAVSNYPSARVYSFEPVGANFVQLKKNADLNPDFPISCCNEAVYDKCGQVQINYESAGEFSTTANVSASSGTTGHSENVRCTTLESVFQRYAIEICDLLKMDCEGSEYAIVYSCPKAILKRISQMAIEVHEGPAPEDNIDALEQYLSDKGYTTERYQRHMLWAWR